MNKEVETGMDAPGNLRPLTSRRKVTPTSGGLVSLETLLADWQGARESLRVAALLALREEQPAIVAPLGKTFSITETARIAGVSRQTVHTALRAGALHASPLHPTGRRRIREGELRRWLEGRPA